MKLPKRILLRGVVKCVKVIYIWVLELVFINIWRNKKTYQRVTVHDQFYWSIFDIDNIMDRPLVILELNSVYWKYQNGFDI